MHVIFALIMLNLARTCFAAVLPLASAQLFNGKPFVVIWNAPIDKCQQLKIHVDLSVFQAITTPAKVQNQTLTLFYKKRVGLFPYRDTQTLREHNGGIPQRGNLTASLRRFKEEITQYIPASVPGLAIIDWEEWLPLFEQNADLREIYKMLSINYTLQQESSLTYKQATIQAKQQFEKAARSFMEETLKLGISERPQYLWGYYLYPDCYNHDFENPDYTGKCSKNTKCINTELNWLWKASTAIFPSAYIPVSISGSQKAALFVRNQVLEALRVAALFKHHYNTPVYLYLRPLLRDQKKKFMQETDLVRSIGESAALGAAGCVLWGSSYDFNDKVSCDSLATYSSKTLNPYIVNVTTAVQLCSNLLCKGNGRCIRKKYDSDDYLYLNIKSFNIQKSGREYHVTGKPSDSDLIEWAYKFTCQCYVGKNCSATLLPGLANSYERVTGHLTMLFVSYTLFELLYFLI